MRIKTSSQIHAALLAAKWAQQIGLPAGNLWEPAIARSVLRDYHIMAADGEDDAAVWTLVETAYALQLGLSHA